MPQHNRQNVMRMRVVVQRVTFELNGKIKINMDVLAESVQQSWQSSEHADSGDSDGAPDLLQLLGDCGSGQHLWSEEKWPV